MENNNILSSLRLLNKTAKRPWAHLPMTKIIMKLVISATLVTVIASFALASSSENWRKDRLCGRRIPDLQAVSLEGCLKAYCATINDLRICVCKKTKDTDEIQLTLEYKGAIKKQWAAKVMPFMFGLEVFRLDAADLDGDSNEEFLFAAMETQSNGMGIEYWTIWAIDEGHVSKPIEIQDYGTMGYLTSPEEGRGCQLLVARWQDGWEPERGAGLYIVGRWYVFRNGEFSPRFDRPAIYRRYLISLERLRGESLSKKPILWYKSSKAHQVIGPHPW
jgi:hypothetical protein